LEEFAALAVEGDAFLLLHLPLFEEGLLLRVVERRVFELLAELAEVFLEFADAGEALVVVLLDAGALHVDLLLRFVRAVVLLEKLLHIDRGDVELAVLGDSHGGERGREGDGEKATNEDHVLGKLGFQKRSSSRSMNEISGASTLIPGLSPEPEPLVRAR